MIRKDLQDRILLLDGALGTMIQTYGLTEYDFRGERYSSIDKELKGCNDVLVLTVPHIIKEIHTQYLEAGADIISTNSFNANAVSLVEYGLQDDVYEINYRASQLVCEAIRDGGFKNRYVAGSVGPTGRAASISPNVVNPAERNITFAELQNAYLTQIKALIDGGADIILLETVFDTLNVKAAIMAHSEVCKELNRDVPLMISATISDNSGRTLSGQTVEAFNYSVEHATNLLTVGLNCSFGAELLYPYVKQLAECSSNYISVHPNAGLPDIFGAYSHTPEIMCHTIKQFLDEGLVNIVGGCCGSTPKHIASLKQLIGAYKPHVPMNRDNALVLTGLECLKLDENIGFINVGERANVAGSTKFARLIREKNYEEALDIVRIQIEAGARIIDICMDDAMLDSMSEMRNFLNLLQSEPDLASVPVMLDSSKWETLEMGMQCVQGKSIVNSISLKEGEQTFIDKAMKIHNYGAAVVVMLFDENGQADTYDRKCAVATRSYKLLVDNGFLPNDIIFDPNILTIGTGIEEHSCYGIDFINAIKFIKQNLPYAKVSGGVSNLSFAFRGNNIVREAMHSAFLYHAIAAGMDMAIVNASSLLIYEDIDVELLQRVEDVIFNKNVDATERLVELASSIKTANASAKEKGEKIGASEEWRKETFERRIEYALVRGITSYIIEDVMEAYTAYGEAVKVIEICLMNGMKQVGELFADGKMFLPQVVKSARVMKQAVDILAPYMVTSDENDNLIGTALIATVKGDVHDIGKNIVSIVLACNGFKVVDLGVMTPAEKIIEAIKIHNPSVLILSGLITPSLDEMRTVIDNLNHEKIDIDLLIGGATTSKLHTAVKLAPNYKGLVAYTGDASACASLASRLLSNNRDSVLSEILIEQEKLRKGYEEEMSSNQYLTVEDARLNRFPTDFSLKIVPKFLGELEPLELDIAKVVPFINWTYFFKAWQITGKIPSIFEDKLKGEEARRLYDDAQNILNDIIGDLQIKALYGIYSAYSTINDEIVVNMENGRLIIPTPRQLKDMQGRGYNLALSDFIDTSNDYLGLMTLSVFNDDKLADKYKNDDYKLLMIRLLCDRLVEASAEYLHYIIRTDLWGYSKEDNDVERILRGHYKGIRPAFGYSSLPDHTQKIRIFEAFDIEKKLGTHLTESGAMLPQSSICALVMAHPQSKYFN